MTINEFIKELIELQEQGKGNYLVRDGCQGEDLTVEQIIVDDDSRFYNALNL